MKTALLLILALTVSALAGCATSTNGRAGDAGREFRSSDGYQTFQQSIRF